MTAEYHKKIFEIQQAISKREMHRLELEKELSRVRNRKETNNEKLRFKIRKLKQEVSDEERSHRRSVETLLNKIKSQKKEYELLQKKTSQIRAKKDHLVFLNSLQNSLRATPVMYTDIYWPRIQDSSSQTEPEMKETIKITEGTQITPRVVRFQPGDIFIKDHIYNSEAILRHSSDNLSIHPSRLGLSETLSRHPSELGYSEAFSRYPSGSGFTNLPVELPYDAQFGYSVIKNPIPSDSHQQFISSSHTNSLPMSSHTQERIYKINDEIHNSHQTDATEYSQQPKSNIKDIFRYNESLETVNSPKSYIEREISSLNEQDTPAPFLSQPQRIDETYNNDISVCNRNEIQTTSTERSQGDEVNKRDASSSSDKKENERFVSHLREQDNKHSADNITESGSFVEHTSKNNTADDVKPKKGFTESIKLLSFTPVKSKLNEETAVNKDSRMNSEAEIQNNTENNEEKLPETQNNFNYSLDKSTEQSPTKQLSRTNSETHGTGIENLPAADEKGHLNSNEIEKDVNDARGKQSPDSKSINILRDETNLKLDSSQPDTSHKLFDVEKQDENIKEAEVNSADILKTTEIKENDEKKKYYERNIYDEPISNKSTDAYKQMLRRISHEPLDIDDDDDERGNNRFTNPTINELSNYDAESIDSVEAAIQAATKGNGTRTTEPTSPSSNCSRMENKISAPPSPAKVRPGAPIPIPDTPVPLGPQIKKPMFSKPIRVNDPLKISLDSDSESLSPLSAGDDPSDNDDDSFFK